MKIPKRIRKSKKTRKQGQIRKQSTRSAVRPKRNNRSDGSSGSRDGRAAVVKAAADPAGMTKIDRGAAINTLNSNIENAKSGPPEGASLLLRAAYFLRTVLMQLDPDSSNTRQDARADDSGNRDSPADQSGSGDASTTRVDSSGREQSGMSDGAGQPRDPLDNLAAQSKDPAHMSREEILSGLKTVDAAIQNGKVLLPADAGLLQRLLYALKLALLQLGGVEPEIGLTNRDALESLINSGQGNGTQPAPATQAAVTKAANNVQRVRDKTDSARNQNETGQIKGLDRLRQTAPAGLTASDLQKALDDVDQAIADSKVLLPADAGLLQRFLYALKLALLQLGGVDPEFNISDRDALNQLITERSGGSGSEKKPETEAAVQRATEAVQKAQAQIKSRAESNEDISGVERLKKKMPDDLSAADLSQALSDVDRAIADSKVLLPADAGLLQRFLYALKLALLRLGDVDPAFDIRDREALNQLIAERSKGNNPTPNEAAAVTNGAATVQSARRQIAARNRSIQDVDLAGIKRLKEKVPADLSAADIRQALDDVDRAIADSKLLLPADAGLLQRLLYALQLALLKLGHVDPEIDIRDRDGLEQLIAQRMAENRPDPQSEADVTRVTNMVLSAQKQVVSTLVTP